MHPLCVERILRSNVIIQRACIWVAICLLTFSPMVVYSQQPLFQPNQGQNRQTNSQQHLGTQNPQQKSSATSDSSNPISPRRSHSSNNRATPSSVQSFSVWKMLGVLVLAIAGIFGAAKLLKFWGPFQSIRQLPSSVYDVLGHTTIPPRHSLYLIRIGQKLVLLGATNDNLTNLTEISDQNEIASITHSCRATGESETEEGTMFARLLNQVKPDGLESTNPTVDESGAREELEARLKSFAHS